MYYAALKSTYPLLGTLGYNILGYPQRQGTRHREYLHAIRSSHQPLSYAYRQKEQTGRRFLRDKNYL